MQRRSLSTSSAKLPLSSGIKFWSATGYGSSSRCVVGYSLTSGGALTAAPSQVMGLAHPAINTRDAALFMSFRRTLGYKPNEVVPLATLVKQFMGRDIEQNGDIPVSDRGRVKDASCTAAVLTKSGAGGAGAGSPRPIPFVRAGLGRDHCDWGMAVFFATVRVSTMLHIADGFQATCASVWEKRAKRAYALRIPHGSRRARRDRRKMYECNHGLCSTCTGSTWGRASLASCKLCG